MSLFELNLNLVAQASACLEGKIRRTPVEFSPWLSEKMGTETYFKLESLQVTGSFKVRGALFFLSTLSHSEKKRGVAACSAGNHGIGVAYACHLEKVPCTIYVPQGAAPEKKRKIEEWGATLKESRWIGYDDTLLWAEQQAKEAGETLISAFDDERIMAANGGTLGAEIAEEMGDVANLLFPVGGGGMSSGIAYYFEATRKPIRLIGCQLSSSPGLQLSLEEGKARTSLPGVSTIAGGLEGGLGVKCFAWLRGNISDVLLVEEHELREACLWMLENHQYLIEPSAAAPLACCLFGKTPPLSGKTILILTGRNVSLERLNGG